MPKLVHKYAFLMRILFSKNAQDPTRDLLDPLVEFVRWYPHSAQWFVTLKVWK